MKYGSMTNYSYYSYRLITNPGCIHFLSCIFAFFKTFDKLPKLFPFLARLSAVRRDGHVKFLLPENKTKELFSYIAESINDIIYSLN